MKLIFTMITFVKTIVNSQFHPIPRLRARLVKIA